ncbi:hypothetical protein D4764_10G0002060 [Takifugu flavidus]|uniref:EF-hand domain-containing protein n=1 Tax=Takifugu flavidus TaxID=433684 RepID=A0A5C6PJQ9_9TELE|nr:hypothetical protein D4764_10G0002060 [Takifugu flavidus]
MADKSEQTILTAMDFLKETFHKYADMDDDKGTMSKKELTDLVRKHVNVTIESHYDYFFKTMDEDKDAKITFKEYMYFLTDMYNFR